MSSPTTPLPAPMSLGRILDRSLRLTPRVFTQAIIPLLLQAALQVVFDTASRLGNLPLLFSALALQIVLGFYISLAVALLAGEYWLGRESTLLAVSKRITWKTVGRVIVLGLVTFFGTLLWSLLFLIPGIVYFINRLLGMYIVLFEDATPKIALKKSKFLMTRGRWYDPKAPLLRFFGISTLLWFVQVFASILAGGSQYLFGWGSLDEYAAFGILFIACVFTQFTLAFSYLSFVGFYYDIRARYEGADLETGIEQLSGNEALA